MAYSLIVSCAHCGQQNRIPVARIGQNPACGSCKSALAAPDEPLEVGDHDLASLLRESPVPVVVDFWAPWCGPCRMIGPPLSNLAREFAGKLLVAKVNVDDNPASAQANDARSIPLLVGFSQWFLAKRFCIVCDRNCERTLPDNLRSGHWSIVRRAHSKCHRVARGKHQ